MALKTKTIERCRSLCWRLSFCIIIYLAGPLSLFASQFDKELTIPIYPSATEMKSYSDDEAKVYSKSYHIKLDYPPINLISFYDEEMQKRSFCGYEKDGDSAGRWIEFEDISSGTFYHVHQFSKIWINSTNKQKAVLLLTYKSEKRETIYDKLWVTLQVMPFFDEKALNEFFSELENDGKFEEFMRLLKRYSAAEKIDFIKAISENPNNLYLQRYQQILKNMDRQMAE